jgi:2'-5' RNA ligase
MINNNSSIRAFFAVDIPHQVKENIFKIISDKTSSRKLVRWTSPENLHITLQFIPFIKIIDVTTILHQLKMELQNEKTFYLKLGPLELFPDKNNPTVISLSILTGKNELIRLAMLIGNILNRMSYPIETRHFRPHLTLGKLNNCQQKNLLENIKIPALEALLVKEVILFESRHEKEKILYIPFAKIPLKE